MMLFLQQRIALYGEFTVSQFEINRTVVKLCFINDRYIYLAINKISVIS